MQFLYNNLYIICITIRRVFGCRCTVFAYVLVDDSLTHIKSEWGTHVKGVISTGPGSVRNRSDFDSSGSVNRKRVYGLVCDQSEPSS